MSFEFTIPTEHDDMRITVEQGTSLIFVGANGSGKTRLAVRIENEFGLNAHRISAHRALSLNPGVAKISEEIALSRLKTGDIRTAVGTVNSRPSQRWKNKMATALLDDFSELLQVLFTEQANKSLETHKKVRAGDIEKASPTKFEKLIEFWEKLLIKQKLHISGDNIEVEMNENGIKYSASEMSAGERAIFYLIW